MMENIVYFVIFASVGVTVEVVFTAIARFRKSQDNSLKGYSYIWMIPIYGLAYPLLAIAENYYEAVHLLIRGVAYTLILYILEYMFGLFLRKILGKCPWEDNYKGSRYSVNNLIRLDFIPAWFVLTLLLERLYVFLH